MISRTLAEITKADIDALVQDSVPEGRQIDYKREFSPGGDRRLSFLKDVAAFANTIGGDIIYGIDEETDSAGKATGRPKNACGLKAFGDAEKLRLDAWVREGIDPRPLVRFHEVDGFTEGPVLVVRVERSWIGPHMVDGDFRFLARGNSGNYWMDVSQVRAAFLQSHAVNERIREFVRARIRLIRAKEVTVRLQGGPTYILYVVPVSAFTNRQQVDLKLAHEAVLPPAGGGNSRYNADGWLIVNPPEDYLEGRSIGYVQVFRDGTIEGVRCFPVSHTKSSIPGGQMLMELNRTLDQYLRAIKRMHLAAPCSVNLTIIHAKGLHLAMAGHDYSEPIDRDPLELPDLWLEDQAWGQAAHANWRPVFDILAQATGLENCPYYDSEGRWSARR